MSATDFQLRPNNSPAQLPARKKSRHSLVELVLISLAILYAVTLLLGPLAAIAWGAVADGFGSFARLLTSPDALSALGLTVLLTVSATIINTIFGVCIALVLAREDFYGRRLLNALVDLPFAVSPVIAGFMVILLFGRNGSFAPWSDALGIKIVFALPGMLLVTIFVSLPFVIREVIPVLQQAGVEQEQAAQTMGASAWQTFWHITLPSIRWGLLYGVSLTFARSMGEFGAVLVVSGGISRLTESSTLFIFRSLDDRNYVGAYAMALLLVVISLSVLGVMETFKKRASRH